MQKSLVTSPLYCSYLCTTNPKCLSYNYKRRGPGDKGLCELNKASRKTNPGSYLDNPQYDHYYDVETEVNILVMCKVANNKEPGRHVG